MYPIYINELFFGLICMINNTRTYYKTRIRFSFYIKFIYNLIMYLSVSTAKSMAYNSLSRIAWGLALTIQIVACQCGLGGFINSLLSWRGWVMLGRLTYNVFLVHLGLFSVYTSLLRHTIPLRPDFEFVSLWISNKAFKVTFL